MDSKNEVFLPGVLEDALECAHNRRIPVVNDKGHVIGSGVLTRDGFFEAQVESGLFELPASFTFAVVKD